LNRIPEGCDEAFCQSHRYGMTKSTHTAGRSIKLFAQHRGGTDIISLNVYRPTSGSVLKPCEMPEAKDRAFVQSVLPDPR
jgi:hypothetical protein